MIFKELVEIFEEKFETLTLADIARELDVTPQVINNWKIKDQVPYKYVKLIRKKIIDLEMGNVDHSNPIMSQLQYQSKNIVENHSENIKYIINDTIKFFRKLLMKQYLIILLTPLIITAYAIFYALSLQPIYQSVAKILPSSAESSSGGGSLSSFASQFGVNLGGGNNSVGITSTSLYPDIIMSRTLARNVLKLKFDSQKFDNKKPLLNILMNIADSASITENDIKKGINSLTGLIKVSSSRESPLLIISATSNESNLSRDIVSAVINELDRMQSEFRLSRLIEKKVFIEKRIKTVLKELTNAEEELKEFRLRNREIKLSPALRLQEDRYKREVQTINQLYLTLKTQYEIAQIDVIERSSNIDIIDPPESPLFRIGPRRKLIVIISMFFGVILGLVLGIFKDLAEAIKKA